MPVRGLENVGVVVSDIEGTSAFFEALGLTRLGEGPGGSAEVVEGDWVDRVVGLQGIRERVVMLQTPDGHGRLELMQFEHPPVRDVDRDAPANTHGFRRVAFSVDDVDATVRAVRDLGFDLMGEVVDFEDRFRLCYVRGPEGLIVMLAEVVGDES